MADTATLAIQREIVIDAPADLVWRTITEPDQIVRWFADRVELDLRPGASGSLVFEDAATTRPIVAAFVVESVDPPHRFSFRWSHPEDEAPVAGNSVLVEFTLTPESDARTRLRVVESGLDAVGWSDDEKAGYVDDHRHGWAIHFGRLAELFPTPAG
jgi:uncharacterized protein YndB with AHSA1/START domain